jgi:hypothetical protein
MIKKPSLVYQEKNNVKKTIISVDNSLGETSWSEIGWL